MMESQMSSHKEDEGSSIFSRNFRITALLEICIQPSTKEEMKSILTEFWHKFEECVHKNTDFYEGDVLYMYALYYVYKHNYLSLSAVSRSLYAYTYKVGQFSLEGNLNEYGNLNDIFYLPEKRLQNIFQHCLCNLNLGHLRFFMKFVALDFPIELNEEARNIATCLVIKFNSIFQPIKEENFQGDKKIFINIDDFLKLLKHSEITCRRALFMFYWILLIFEYHFVERSTIEMFGLNIVHTLKSHCIAEFICLDFLTETTTETLITLTDIDNFQLKFLNFQPNKNAISFMNISKKYLLEIFKSYTPKLLKGENECHTTRSLKDLTRCKIRQSLQHSKTLPEQVYQLTIPVALKEFLLFDNGDIWKSLEDYQEITYLHHKFGRLNEE